MIGTQISHYRILEKLGEGGMGVVYRAEDTRLGRPVALKFLSRAALGNAANRTRLIQEARTAAGLQHPGICTIFDIEESGDNVFISMAYLEGQTLRECLESGPLSIDGAVRITTQIARALSEAHARGFVHRDIKSANIMVDEHGDAVILDFGLAIGSSDQTLPMEGTAVGTAAYMSPEQARGEAVDGRADLWSLGVCLYEMLTGQRPFEGPNDAALIYAILNREPTPVRRLRPEVPEPLEEIVSCLLSKNRGDRCPDAGALLGDLRALRSGASVPAARRVPSIAVLPFENMSNDPEQEYFCAGIAEDIINDLTRIDELRVAARTTSFAWKARLDDIREVGRRIGVGAVLEGSVRKAGNRLRIAAQLIDVETGYHMWSERWDREIEDVFAIQDEISRNIVAALKVELTPAEREEMCRPGTTSVDAYDLYLRGRQNLYGNFKHVRFACEMFQQAIEKDPQYAQAHAGLALACSMLTITEPHTRMFGAALDAATRAIALNPNLAEAHAACAFASGATGDYEGAEREYETALRLNPDLYETYYFFGRTSFSQGKVERAAEMFEKAAEVDPREYQGMALAATAYRAMGRHDQEVKTAARAFERITRHVALNPEDGRALCLGASVLVPLGRYEEAVEWMEKAIAVEGRDPGVMYNIACAYGAMGDGERTLEHLEKAVDLGFSMRSWAEHDGDFNSVRDDPRFQTLLARMK